MPLSPEDLKQLKEALAKATPGPWKNTDWKGEPEPEIASQNEEIYFRIYDEGGHTTEDATFIVLSRNLLPTLIEEYEKQAETIRWLKQTVHQAHHEGPIEDCKMNTCTA